MSEALNKLADTVLESLQYFPHREQEIIRQALATAHQLGRAEASEEAATRLADTFGVKPVSEQEQQS